MNPHGPDPARRRRRLFTSLRSNFLTGIVVIAPIALTIWLIWNVVGWIDDLVLPWVPSQFHPDRILKQLMPESDPHVRGFGLIIFFSFAVLIGWLAKGLIGRSLLRWGESLVDRMPVIRSIYGAVKQIAETVFAQSDSSFQKVCLVEYPRKGVWVLAFVSTDAKGEVRTRVPGGEAADGGGPDERVLSVFMPTTPNPTTGFLFFVPESSVVYLDMTVEEAAKLIISAGLVSPPERVPQVADNG